MIAQYRTKDVKSPMTTKCEQQRTTQKGGHLMLLSNYSISIQWNCKVYKPRWSGLTAANKDGLTTMYIKYDSKQK